MLKRVASLTMCLLLVLSALLLASCGGDETTTSNSGNTGDTAGFLNEAKNWGGEIVNILGLPGDADSFNSCQVDINEPSDEPVHDAFFQRNSLIEEKYGINIEVVLPGEGEDAITMLREDILSGSGEYQAIVNSIHNLAPLATDGLLIDFKGIENGYLHLDQDWWDQTLIDDTAINNKAFFLAGDAIVCDDENTWAMYFNKDMIKKYDLESPYDLVKAGDWTLDKMYEMLQVPELTHGSVKSYDPEVGDVWGMVVQSYDFYQFMMGCEQVMVDNTGDLPVLRVEEEENVNTFQKIAEFFNVSVEELTGKSPKPNLTNNINLGRAKLSIQQTSVISKKNRLVFLRE